MDSAFYTDLSLRLDRHRRGSAELTGTVTSDPACGGPWSPQLQHGGPPNALLVLVAERLAAVAAGRAGPGRGADGGGVHRPGAGRRAADIAPGSAGCPGPRCWSSAELGDGSSAASLQARIWLLAPGEQPRDAQDAAGRRRPSIPSTLPPFDFDPAPTASATPGQLDWRLVSGSACQPGPAAAWIRPRIPLVAGYRCRRCSGRRCWPTRPAASRPNSAGTSWSFANVDLDLHLFRAGAGDWLLVDAVTRLGAGVATDPVPAGRPGRRCRRRPADPAGAPLTTADGLRNSFELAMVEPATVEH